MEYVNVLREQTRMHVDMLFKHEADRVGVQLGGGKAHSSKGVFPDLKVPAHASNTNFKTQFSLNERA